MQYPDAKKYDDCNVVEPRPTTIFHNARFHTLDADCPGVSALAVREGHIVATGDPDALLLQFPESILQDMGGVQVFPGFNDAHIHVWKVGSLQSRILDLRGVASKERLLEKLERFGRQAPAGQWVLARGFNEALWPTAVRPTCAELDRVLPDRPCQLMRTCAHVVVANSAALRAAGLTKDTPDPEGGAIGRFADGTPNGVLYEKALRFLAAQIPPFSRSEYREMILEAQERLLSEGICSATDPEVTPEQWEAYQELDAEGLLKVRMNIFPVRLPDGRKPKTLCGAPGEGLLQVDTIKFFADGGLSGKTAALSRPYPGTDETGLLHLPFDTFLDRARQCQEAGWRIATHAIGDRAIEQVIEVYERLKQVKNAHLRHRIEHVGLPSPEHLRRMKALGIIVVSQPIFLTELGRNFRLYLDEGFCRLVYPYRQMLDAGIPLAFSSDAPVVRDFGPLSGIRAAMERKDYLGEPVNPEEAVSAEESLYAYTVGGAVADGQEAFKGKLRPGYVADMVALTGNPCDTSPTSLGQGMVKNVWVGGRLLAGRP